MADTSDGGANAHLQSGPEEAGPALLNGEPRPGWSVLSLSRENGHGSPVDLEQGRPKLKPQVSSLSRVDVPITVKFRDVRYEVTLRPHEPWFQRLSLKKTGEALTTVRKEILHGINGAVLPGKCRRTLISVQKQKRTKILLCSSGSPSSSHERRKGCIMLLNFRQLHTADTICGRAHSVKAS